MDGPRALGPIGDTILYEDERIRVWEMVLEPGEASPAHHHEHDYVVVTVEGNRLAVIPADGDEERSGPGYGEAEVHPGEIFVLHAGATEIAHNTGSVRYRDIQIELKGAYVPDLDVKGVRIRFQVRGEGPPLVWVSGTGVGGGIWDWWQIPHFSTRYTCITFDLRGTGESDAPPGPYRVADFAADTIALCRHLGIERAHFAGISLGSAIIQEVALAQPDLVRSAALISTWSCTPREEHLRRWFQARLTALQEGPVEVFRAFSFWMSSPTVIDLEPELQKEIDAFFAKNSSAQPLEAYISHFQADLGHDTLDRLPGIRCPVLVVHGDEDLITLPRYNRTVADAIRGAELVEIPGAGHFAWLERGAEVNDALTRFLDRVEQTA